MLEMRLAPPASKYLKKLKDKKLRELFRNALDGICENPYIGKLKRGDLSGIYGYDLYYAGEPEHVYHRTGKGSIE